MFWDTNKLQSHVLGFQIATISSWCHVVWSRVCVPTICSWWSVKEEEEQKLEEDQEEEEHP